MKEYFSDEENPASRKWAGDKIRLICWNYVEESAGIIWKGMCARSLAFKSVYACERANSEAEGINKNEKA